MSECPSWVPIRSHLWSHATVRQANGWPPLLFGNGYSALIYITDSPAALPANLCMPLCSAPPTTNTHMTIICVRFLSVDCCLDLSVQIAFCTKRHLNESFWSKKSKKPFISFDFGLPDRSTILESLLIQTYLMNFDKLPINTTFSL